MYVAADGTWGDAASIALIDDSAWLEGDYQLLETIQDSSRADLAEAIDAWIRRENRSLKIFGGAFVPEKEYLGEALLLWWRGY